MSLSRQERRRIERTLDSRKSRVLKAANVDDIADLPKKHRQVFFLEGCDPLNEEHMKTLEEQGWPMEELKRLQGKAAFYCSERESLIFPEPSGLEVYRDDGELKDDVNAMIVDGEVIAGAMRGMTL